MVAYRKADIRTGTGRWTHLCGHDDGTGQELLGDVFFSLEYKKRLARLPHLHAERGDMG
jgi:hypothetical protein